MNVTENVAEIVLQLKQDFDDVYAAGKATGGGGGSGGEDLLKYVTTISGLFQYSELPADTELELYLPMLFTNTYVINVINQAFFFAKGLKSVKLKCDVRDIPALYTNMFYHATSVKIIDLTEFNTMVSNLTQTFMGCNTLEEIKGEFDFSQCTSVNAPFNGTNNLIEVRFKANTLSLSISLNACSKLSDESIQSIIDGLADLTGGTAQTLTVHKTVYEKIIANGWDALITAKNWILVSA